MKYERVLVEIYRKPWAIMPEKLATICEIVNQRSLGEKLSQEEILARLEPYRAAARTSDAQSFGVVAVIPIYGVISHRMNLMSQVSGGTSIEKLTAQFRSAVADPAVKAIVFDIDSPGGTVEGVPELADEILGARSKKKTVAVANCMAGSAAYWLASAADELVVAPSGAVGSIGIFAAHEDISAALEKEGVKVTLVSAGKYKTEGNELGPLSDEARAAMQAKIDAFYGMFVKSVAKGRGAAQASVRDGFGQGRMVLAADAVKQGMADRVGTFDETLGRLGAGNGGSKKMAAASVAGAIRADAPDGDPEAPDDDCDCACDACETGACNACTNAQCADSACAAAGCPNQASAKAKALAALNRRRREIELH
jgi:signal peptide peptidase SppA